MKKCGGIADRMEIETNLVMYCIRVKLLAGTTGDVSAFREMRRMPIELKMTNRLEPL